MPGHNPGEAQLQHKSGIQKFQRLNEANNIDLIFKNAYVTPIQKKKEHFK
jgi:hypothetical protein